MADMVNHPPHYNAHPAGIEAIVVCEAFNFNVGNAIKYLWRSGFKGALVEDLLKARWYVDREVKRVSGPPWLLSDPTADLIDAACARSDELKEDGKPTGPDYDNPDDTLLGDASLLDQLVGEVIRLKALAEGKN